MDSIGKIRSDMLGLSREVDSGHVQLTLEELADRIDALMKEPVAEIISHNTAANVWWHTIPDELPIGTKLFAAPPASAVGNPPCACVYWDNKHWQRECDCGNSRYREESAAWCALANAAPPAPAQGDEK